MPDLEFPRWAHKASLPIESKLVKSKEEFEQLGSDWHPWKSEAVSAFKDAAEKAVTEAAVAKLALEEESARIAAEAKAAIEAKAAKKSKPEPEVKS